MKPPTFPSTARADGATRVTSARARRVAPPPEPTEAEMMRAVVEAARLTGWRIHHTRPGRTMHGWRTPLEGDKGFPDAVMIHPRAGLCWFVEFKARYGRLSADQERWGRDLAAAGCDWRTVRGRAGLTALLDDMATLPRVAR